MAALKSTDSTQVHLLHDHVYSVPGSDTVISLKAGEKFLLVRKVSHNWWSVVRPEKDSELLYIPASYVEEIGSGKKLEVGATLRKELPPKPPIKPKNLLGKRELPTEMNKHIPSISEEAHIELFNILVSQNTRKSIPGDIEKQAEKPVGENCSEENGTHPGRHGHKGSMQSLDVEFLDDFECSRLSTGDKVADEGEESVCVNTGLLHPRGHQSILPPWPPDGALPLKTFDGGFEMYVDEDSGRKFYYNHTTGERSWILPRKTSQSSKENVTTEIEVNNGLNSDFPLTWKEEFNDEETFFVSPLNGEKWIQLYDEKGREYFFNDSTKESRWELPQLDDHKYDEGPDKDFYQFSDKDGVLYKAKLSENGKKIKKSWSHSYVVLCGSMLYFYKEQKTSNNQKSSMSKPEAFVDLRSATIQMGNNIRSSRKNLIQLTTTNDTEFLLHHEEADVIEEWYEALSKNIGLLTRLMSTLKTSASSNSLDNEIDKSPSLIESPGTTKKNKDKQKQQKKAEVGADVLQSSAEKTKLKEKLRFWLNRRPTRDSLKAKGIYKEDIFGSHLLTICEKEKSLVPIFVQDCIAAVEERGLTTDGIYRLSGNMADIQKLRLTVNANEKYDLLDPEMDIHIVTGALKLFFRELLEPLFPFRFYKKFLDAFRITNHTEKSKAIRELVLLIPSANYDTLKELFRHLVLVIQHSHENRMQAQNIAIIFGPTLMWPDENESSDLAVAVVQRGQLIEHILQDYSSIFT